MPTPPRPRRPALLAACLALALAAACATPPAGVSGPPDAPILEDAIVETACGQCQFGLEGEGCDLAVRVGDHAWFVTGTDIDDHGDAHADDGFCNAVRRARVTGHVTQDGVLAVSHFELLPD